MRSPRSSRQFLSIAAIFTVISTHVVRAHQFRPALVGSGPKSLANLIDEKKLVAKGQHDAVVMFDAAVEEDGSVGSIWCHGPPEANALKDEVEKELRHASFVPAAIDGTKTEVAFHGTVVFVSQNGRPHLRVFANQDRAELARESDYIQPQLVVDSEDWDGAEPLLELVKNHARRGHAVLSITLDADGKVLDRKLLREDPS